MNQIGQRSTPGYVDVTYDYDGNLTADGRWTYTWDADGARQRGDGQTGRFARRASRAGARDAGGKARQNRLVAMETRTAVVTPNGPLPVSERKKLEFKYDYMSRRVEKAVFSWNAGSSAWDLVTRTRSTYFGWNLIGEYAVSGGTLTLTRSYTWGIDLGGVSAGGAGGLLAIREAATGASYLPAYDGAGNLTALMDRSSGAVVAAYEYSPFGETIRSTGTYAATNPFRSATKYTDTETGLVYYGYRYYSPALGRFINRDPIGEAGGLNLYGFVGNSPTNAWDVLGLKKVPVLVGYEWVCHTNKAGDLECGWEPVYEWREVPDDDQHNSRRPPGHDDP
ncbi:MAG: hypothetical protein PHE83_09270, partial [Opitutaceae bacterium]|nr:hypothetical protein [Opitutaceae bacterium]